MNTATSSSNGCTGSLVSQVKKTAAAPQTEQLLTQNPTIVENASSSGVTKVHRARPRAPLRELPTQWNTSSLVGPTKKAINPKLLSLMKPRVPTTAHATTYGRMTSTHALQSRIALASSPKRARLSEIYASYPPCIAASALDVQFGFEEGSWPNRPTAPADASDETMGVWLDNMQPLFNAARQAEAEIARSKEMFEDTATSSFVVGTLQGKRIKSLWHAKMILEDSQKRFQTIRV